MTDFFNWLVTSSADSEKFSLTVKAALLAIAPLAVVLLGLDGASYGTLVQTVANLVLYIGSAISAIGVLIGVVRKIRLGRWSAVS